MNYYRYKDKKIISKQTYDLTTIDEKEVKNSELIYYFYTMNTSTAKDTYIINSVSDLDKKQESIEDIKVSETIPQDHWLEQKIKKQQVVGINTAYADWENLLDSSVKNGYKINLLGLGDVGSTLLIGLKLLGKDLIDEIGIYDLDQQKMQRWEHELNQICYPQAFKLPEVNIINEGDLFNCDMFVFTASKFVPKVGSKTKDVRMAQFEANADIVRHYASMAKDQAFKGIFSVVSDPVDLLCNVVLEASNLKPSQIKGYGLGVMNGRANYYSQQMDLNYEQEGRVFGPHGKGLVVANSIENYNNDLSNTLTQQVVKANLAIRALGYKPYIAPALSSGALSIVETLKGNWQYSTVFINAIYWGVKNRLIHNSVQIETLDLPEVLMDRIKESYKELKEHYENNKDT